MHANGRGTTVGYITGKRGRGTPRRWFYGALLAGVLLLLAGSLPGGISAQDGQPGCPGAALPQGTWAWWVQEVAGGDGPPLLLLGCAELAPCADSDDAGDDDDGEEEDGDDDDGSTSGGAGDGSGTGDGPGRGGEDIPGGRFQTLAAWDPALADVFACAAPVLMELSGGVLVCWDAGAGQLCARAFTITAWDGGFPAAGELSDPVCVSFAEQAGRAQAEADLLATFAGGE